MGILAKYESSLVAEYAGNPLIEALPPILSEQQAAEAIAHFPVLVDTERQLPKEIRLHCIGRLKALVQPLPIHLELEGAVSALLRSGYVSRNPMLGSTWRHLNSLSTDRKNIGNFTSSASTFSLIGLSGIGKTTALEAILHLYPQVLVHHRYQGREFLHTQIVWLKLECPFDGSLSGLCLAFFKAVDRALGVDKYARRYKNKAGILQMIESMEQLASTYFIGALFIDELQHLNAAKTGGKDNMLNFFVNLINSIGIPVAFIGTNSMVDLFSDILRNARRACGLGTVDFRQPEQNDVAWDMLVDVVWDYQWVQNPAILTPQIRTTLYDLTQGVTDFLAKMMMLGQRYAIQANIETLNSDVFQHVADTKMKLLKPAIAALRSRDPKKMRQFEDLLPTDVQIDNMMKEASLPDSTDRLALLRATRPDASGRRSVPTASQVEKQLEKDVASDSVTVLSDQNTANSPNIIISEAAVISKHQNPLSAMRDMHWLVKDPFEFSDVYRQPM
ncbi:ATP-binding protein [Undibacterium sp.]|uniref:ATP-binding protein n=1 Tax=Undibacterium sp. TaxID=1914977 RepID=UPI0025F3C8D6|nr:ATP-binding protein [Undibacterium sp.]